MSVFAAAGTLGELSQWRLTNLEMQKTLYVAQMIHLGRTHQPLFIESFEAWEYGPVVPALYHAVKDAGRNPIPPFTEERLAHGTSECFALIDAFAMTRHLTPSQMVNYVHRPEGAWEQFYMPFGRSNAIPNDAILGEFETYMMPSDDAVAWAEEMADDVAHNPSTYLAPANERAFGSRVLSARLH
jgi:uncharacterized phage-associated protein